MLNGINPRNDPFQETASLFRDADVAYANLEIPLTTSRRGTPFKSAAEVKARTQFVLKADPRHIAHLANAGFDLLSLANNHGMDYGWEGLRQTIGLLEGAGIAHSGGGANMAEAERPAVKTLPSGFRVGMISALAFVGSGALNKCGPAGKASPGIAVFRLNGAMGKDAKQELARRVSAAKKECDFLIVAPHWGEEKKTRPREWQFTLGRALVDAGADAVIGAHPHVLQGKEVYKGRPILYSTGNLASALPAASAVYLLKFEGAEFRGVDVVPVRISGGQTRLVGGKDHASRIRAIEGLDRLIPAPRGQR